jgi:hypothetical protein
MLPFKIVADEEMLLASREGMHDAPEFRVKGGALGIWVVVGDCLKIFVCGEHRRAGASIARPCNAPDMVDHRTNDPTVGVRGEGHAAIFLKVCSSMDEGLIGYAEQVVVVNNSAESWRMLADRPSS